jgi:hypothetical protein
MVEPRAFRGQEEEGMVGSSLRRAVAAGVLMTGLILLPVLAEAAPAARLTVAPDLWASAWEWVASWWEGLGGPSQPAGEKGGGELDPDGAPLAPDGTTSTTTTPLPGPTGTGEVGPGTDPDG